MIKGNVGHEQGYEQRNVLSKKKTAKSAQVQKTTEK